jgi:hypothetical protein
VAFLIAFLKALAAALGLVRDNTLIEAGKAQARDEGKQEAERQEQTAREAASKAKESPRDEDYKYFRD